MLALRGEGFVTPDATGAAMLLACAALGIVAYAALVLATRSGDIALTTPFRYSRLVFALLIGVLVFDERVDGLMLVGCALIVAAGLYTMIREMRLKRL
jgi:drug/metabolite transporter (DMT)-like permease